MDSQASDKIIRGNMKKIYLSRYYEFACVPTGKYPHYSSESHEHCTEEVAIGSDSHWVVLPFTWPEEMKGERRNEREALITRYKPNRRGLQFGLLKINLF